jgi:hypothetical protein
MTDGRSNIAMYGDDMAVCTDEIYPEATERNLKMIPKKLAFETATRVNLGRQQGNVLRIIATVPRLGLSEVWKVSTAPF